VTVVVYDYILMFPSEVVHIWSKPWTWVTLLYLIVRYAGIYDVMGTLMFDGSFVPLSSVKTCAGLFYLGDWANTAFYCASSLLMVLRVHAIWNRSKVILAILLLGYMVRVVSNLILTAVIFNPYTDATVVDIRVPVLHYSACIEIYPRIGPYVIYAGSWSIIFDVVLLILALVPSVQQSIAMYQTTKRWEPNRYISLIIKEGVAYYICLNFLDNIPNVVATLDNLNGDHWHLNPVGWFMIEFFYNTSMFPIVPRFVISMRELFDKDSRGQLEGIDSAFGISSRSGNVAGLDTSVSGIPVADGISHPGEEGGEEIQLEVVRGNDSGQGCSA